jgi:hypothetical protein
MLAAVSTRLPFAERAFPPVFLSRPNVIPVDCGCIRRNFAALLGPFRGSWTSGTSERCYRFGTAFTLLLKEATIAQGSPLLRSTLRGSVHLILPPQPQPSKVQSHGEDKKHASIVPVVKIFNCDTSVSSPFHIDLIVYCFERQVGTT